MANERTINVTGYGELHAKPDTVRLTRNGVQLADTPVSAALADTANTPASYNDERRAIRQLAGVLYGMLTRTPSTMHPRFSLDRLPKDAPIEFRLIVKRGLELNEGDKPTVPLVTMAEMDALLGARKPLHALTRHDLRLTGADGECSIVRAMIQPALPGDILPIPDSMVSSQTMPSMMFPAQQLDPESLAELEEETQEAKDGADAANGRSFKAVWNKSKAIMGGTDDTAALAEKAGAIVLVHNDPDPAHHMAAYPLRFGIEHILSVEDDPYEIVIRVDADNRLNAEYSSLMNDAYQSGVDLARPYEGAINAAQNFFTKACTMFYVFESRYGSRVRERLGLAAHVNGSGAMMSARMLKATGGYDCVTISEDAEYYFNRLLDGYKGHFVEDAVVSEDMPSSLKDTYNRNKRIGSGSVSLLKPKFAKLLKKLNLCECE